MKLIKFSACLLILFLFGCEKPLPMYIDAEEEGPFLMIMSFDDAGRKIHQSYYKFQTMQSCLSATKTGKIFGATGGDAEALVLMSCVPVRVKKVRNRGEQ